MANLTAGGWFNHDDTAQAAQSLMSEVADACDRVRTTGPTRYSDRQLSTLSTRTILFLAAVFGFIAAVIVVPNLLPGEFLADTHNLKTVVGWIVVIVPIGFGFAAKNRLRRAARRTSQHDSCIQELTSQFQELRDARLSPVRGPSGHVLPHLSTDCELNLRCSLFGQYRELALAMFEAEYMAPVTLNAKRVLDVTQAKLASDPDTEQFSRMRTAESVVFFRPLSLLPDLFLAGESEPLCSYQARWVTKAGGRPRDSRVKVLKDTGFDGFSSHPVSAEKVLTPTLTDLLSLRPNALVQVVGGFVVVVPRTWGSATPMDTAVQAFEIQLDLDFACAVYEALAACSTDEAGEPTVAQSDGTALNPISIG